MRKHLCLLISFVIICAISLPVVEATSDEVDTYALSEDERYSFLNRIQWVQVDDGSYKNSIYSFDVNKDGTIALAIAGDAVYVYDASGEILYGYRFKYDGDFGVEFHGEILTIYFLRGNSILLIDANGQCIAVQKANDVNQHITKMKEVLNRTIVDTEGKRYFLERDINIGNSYSRFVVEEQGTKIVLYDVTIDFTIKQVS